MSVTTPSSTTGAAPTSPSSAGGSPPDPPVPPGGGSGPPPTTPSGAGSGQLTQRERELVADAQKLVTISPDTRMQKVIPPGDVDKYLDGSYSQVGGLVARQQDAVHMSNPDDLIQGNRLDYKGTPYTPGMSEVHAIEFRAGAPDNYQIPFVARRRERARRERSGGDQGERRHDHRRARRASIRTPSGRRSGPGRTRA